MSACNSLRRAILLALIVTLAAHASAAAESAAKAAKSQAAGKTAATAAAPRLEPKAIDLLKAMSSRLAAAKSMTFSAVSTYESPSVYGPALVYTTISEVTMLRPDKLRVITPGDGPASEFYYDGKTMMAYAPAENLVAVAEAPATVDAALKLAYDSAAIYFPFTDVLVADPYKDIADELKIAFFIGQSHVVGGTTTNMLVAASSDVFAQLWIGADDNLPRMIRAVYAKDPLKLRNQVEFSNWVLDGAIAADAFASKPAAGAVRIQFARPDPKPPADAAPAAKGKSSKKK